MDSKTVIELVVILSLAVSLPALAMAMWHGWKFEQYRADQRVATDWVETWDWDLRTTPDDPETEEEDETAWLTETGTDVHKTGTELSITGAGADNITVMFN